MEDSIYFKSKIFIKELLENKENNIKISCKFEDLDETTKEILKDSVDEHGNLIVK